MQNKPEDSVTRWLMDEDDVASVTSEVSRLAGSEYGDYDSSRYFLEEPTGPEEEVAPQFLAEQVERVLGEIAKVTQMRTVCGFHRKYARGRMLDVPSYARPAPINQKFFRLESFYTLTSLVDEVLIANLKRGSYRTRLGAPTGMGKTMKLPGMLAAKCGIRVCMLELDTEIANEALAYQKKEYGIPGGVKAWSRQKKAYLTAMSYDEFCGIVMSGNRDRLFNDFDLFYMDEAHEPLASVYAARQFFAAYASPETSLIVASATVSTVESNNSAPMRTGMFKEETPSMSLEDAIQSGKLLTEHLKDRTMVIVATDEQAALVRAYYEENGLEVRIQDSASTKRDKEKTLEMLAPETSVVPRVLVATQDYGTGTNFPVRYVVTTATRRVYEIHPETHALIEKEIPLMAKTVVQHQGRVGRGLASGGGGWILSGERTQDKELLASEALTAYLYLVAGGIAPRPGLFSTVTKVLPKGIDAGVARALLRVGVPPALAARYLGTDGRFAAKFVDAMKLFSQAGEVLYASKDQYPVGYDDWIEEQVGQYYEGDDSVTDAVVRVPFESPPGLKTVMHTISAVADKYIEVQRWDWYDEEEASDDEVVGVRKKVKRRFALAKPEEPVKQTDEGSVSTVMGAWAYDVDPTVAALKKRRQAMSWTAGGEGKAAVLALLSGLRSETLGTSVAAPLENVPEHPDQVVYPLPLDEESGVPVVSAGGGEILLVSKEVHKRFMDGDPLSVEHMVPVMRHLLKKKLSERFAKSTVFDNWSPAWLCWFGTYGDTEVVTALKTAGIHSGAMKLLNCLYERFRTEVIAVAVSSNLYKDQLTGFFSRKPSVTKFINAVRKGSLPIAQTDRFVKRVTEIKSKYDDAILAIEEVGIFAPTQVTLAQKKLPIRDGKRQLAVIDEAVVPSDSKVVKEDTVVSWRR